MWSVNIYLNEFCLLWFTETYLRKALMTLYCFLTVTCMIVHYAQLWLMWISMDKMKYLLGHTDK